MKKGEFCRWAAALFGLTSCISCVFIGINLLLWHRIILTEPKVPVVILELMIGVTGSVLNLYVLIGKAKEA